MNTSGNGINASAASDSFLASETGINPILSKNAVAGKENGLYAFWLAMPQPQVAQSAAPFDDDDGCVADNTCAPQHWLADFFINGLFADVPAWRNWQTR